jgi:hypothetical protein
MPTRVLAPLALMPVVGLWVELRTNSFDFSTINRDAEP